MKISKLSTLGDIVLLLNQSNNMPLFYTLNAHHTWDVLYKKEFVDKVLGLATFLSSKGVKKGDHFLSFCGNNPQWFIVDLACQLLGIVTVPIFSNLSANSLKAQISKSQSKYAFIDSSVEEKHVRDYLGEMDFILTTKKNDHRLETDIVLDDIENKEMTNEEIVKEFSSVPSESLASIIYTSGSSGESKGVCLSQKNFVCQVEETKKYFPMNMGVHSLSFLPFNHIFERMVMYFYLSSHLEIYLVGDKEWVLPSMIDAQPHMMTTVPRVLEKLYLGLKEKAKTFSLLKRVIFSVFFLVYNLPYGRFNFLKKLFRRIANKVVGNLGLQNCEIVSGGAKLNKKIHNFFLNLRIDVYQGYGLTEVSPVVATCNKEHNKIDTVGIPYSCNQVRISSEREIQVKGDTVMQGYYNEPELTKEVFTEDGWLKTGDLGSLDRQGYLSIVGRAKSLFKTSGGKYIPTELIEMKMSLIQGVQNVLLIADDKPFVSALIFVGESKDNPFLEKIPAQIGKINRSLSPWERIKKYKIIHEELSIEEGTLTPSMKPRRFAISKKFKKQINKLYKIKK